jgi:Flp pilus assembly protein TadB
MDSGLAAALGNLLILGLMVLGFVSPIVLFIGLIWVARRHLAGRRGRFDGLFEGIGRANAVNSHLQAGTPTPDDLAVPVPPRARARSRRRDT